MCAMHFTKRAAPGVQAIVFMLSTWGGSAHVRINDPDQIAVLVEHHVPSFFTVSMDSVVTLNAEEHEIVPSVRNIVVVDILRCECLLMMHDPSLSFSFLFRKTIPAPFANV